MNATMSDKAVVRVGSRGSALALKQAQQVLDALRGFWPDRRFEMRVIQTLGDRIVDKPISEFGDKAVFVRGIEQALLKNEIDLAVHSLKDVPGDSATPGLHLAAFLPRVDPRDALVGASDISLEHIPLGAVVGTGSLRRRVQLLSIRPDLQVRDIRGNVETRIRKLDDGQYHAIILAAAGLLRLGLQERINQYLPVANFLPDAGQGIITVQALAGSKASILAAAIDSRESRVSAITERAVVRALDADCRSPVGALATIAGGVVEVQAMAARPDLSNVKLAEGHGSVERAETIGRDVGRHLLGLLAL